jgi:sugar/nucleoside kinase (ribokinase family)
MNALTAGAAVVGSTTIDCNLIGRIAHLKIGGVTAYAGLTYRRHGVPTRVITNVAPADAAILERLTRAGARVSAGASEFTTRFVNRVDAGGRRQEVPSVAAPVNLAQLAASEGRADLVHLGPLHPEDIDARVFARLAGAGPAVALDLQGLVRKISAGRVEAAVSEHLPAALAAARIVKSDEAELRLVLEAFGTGVEEIMQRFGVAEWVVTAGVRGGVIHTRGRGSQFYSAAPASPVVDPTGAGDVFFAAYLVGRLRDRKPPAEAARAAAACAAAQVAGRYLTDLNLAPRSPAGEGRESGFNCVDNGLNEG